MQRYRSIRPNSQVIGPAQINTATRLHPVSPIGQYLSNLHSTQFLLSPQRKSQPVARFYDSLRRTFTPIRCTAAGLTPHIAFLFGLCHSPSFGLHHIRNPALSTCCIYKLRCLFLAVSSMPPHSLLQLYGEPAVQLRTSSYKNLLPLRTR
jgi:hypothetical protein